MHLKSLYYREKVFSFLLICCKLKNYFSDPDIYLYFDLGSYFSSGIDISELQRAKNEEELRLIFNTFTQLVETFRRLPLVVISQVRVNTNQYDVKMYQG
jgi:hypothetical protein